jgi:2-polyprenyl-3-methyl-5-hydroxy-6-metoxy-1,4-benzoquinol methylase
MPSGHPLEGDVTVVACDACGMWFNDTDVSQERYDSYYSYLSKYSDVRTSSGAGTSAEDTQRLHDTATAIADFEVNTGIRLLDVGCGSGGLLDVLKAQGFTNLTGMDPSAQCAAIVRGRTHLCQVGSLTQPLPGSEVFQALVLSHVLEHIRDLQPAMRSVRRLLSSDGWFYVEVPDALRYHECIVAPFQDFNLEHINHFTAHSLAILLVSEGFEVVSSGSKTFPLPGAASYPAIWAFAKKATTTQPITTDKADISVMRSYVAKSLHIRDRIEQAITSTVARACPIVVWGVGQFTMRLLAETSLAKANIAAFIDSNPLHVGGTLADAPIISPKAFAERRSEFRDATIVIGTLLHERSIANAIDSLNVANPVVFLRPGAAGYHRSTAQIVGIKSARVPRPADGGEPV